MDIREVEEADWEQWYRQRVELWPDATGPEEADEMRENLDSDTMTTFVAANGEGRLVTLLEAGIRFYAESCVSRNVGYIEGWYVEEEYRRLGIGAALVRAAEEWARSKGCREMASVCLLDNELCLTAHVSQRIWLWGMKKRND